MQENQREEMNKCKCFETLSSVVTLLANVATASAFVIALIQYCKYEGNQRTERSLQMNHSYFQSEVVQARGKLTLGSKEYKEIDKIMGSTLNSKLADKLVANYLLNWAKVREREWLVMYGYYSMAFSCVDKKLCSRADLSPLIESDGYKFFEWFMHYSCEYLSKKTDVKDKKYSQSVQSFYLGTPVDCNFPSRY